MHNNGAKSAGATTIAPLRVVKPVSLAATSPVSSPGSTPLSGGRPVASTAPPEPTGIVDVNKTIIVHAGETFDGGGKYYRPTNALGRPAQAAGLEAMMGDTSKATGAASVRQSTDTA